jgi:ABC-type branched-subunit amino acid transport system ATPase component
MDPRPPALTIRALAASYGPSQALFDVNLDVMSGATTVLLGRNGMGKSSTLKSVMRLAELTTVGGEMAYCDEDILPLGSSELGRRGVGYVPQGRRIFRSLSVDEHLSLAPSLGKGQSGSRKVWTRDELFAMFPRLAERRKSLGGNLSGGEQQMLAIARALTTAPSLLLLDEPTEGLAPALVAAVVDVITTLNREYGITILLAEQSLAIAYAVADSVCIIDRGRSVAIMPASELKERPDLVSQYLGIEL